MLIEVVTTVENEVVPIQHCVSEVIGWRKEEAAIVYVLHPSAFTTWEGEVLAANLTIFEGRDAQLELKLESGAGEILDCFCKEVEKYPPLKED